MSEGTFIQAITLLCATVGFVASLRFIRQLIERRREQRAPVEIDAMQQRLERIENIVESTAIEVERISEANRFMAKLLAERAGAATPARTPERVITPH